MRTYLLAALFTCFLSNAQTAFEKGYFINNSGTKTECYIENLDWRNNPSSFVYKLNETDSEKKTTTISEVSEFGIGNEKLYRKCTLSMERSETITANLQNNSKPQWKTETIFLLAIVTGEANLYSYTDANVNKFFYQVKDAPIEQLVMIRYSNGTTISQNNLYMQQLYNNVKCEKTPESSFRNIEYNQKSLAKHFDLYNSCFEKKSENNVDYLATEKKRESFALRVMPGIYAASISINDPDNYYDASVNLNQTVVKIALEAEFFLPFNKNSWSFFITPGYQKFSPTKNYNSNVINPGLFNNGDEIHYTATIDYAAIDLPIGIRHYFYLNAKSAIFVDLAYAFSFSKSGQSIILKNNDNLANAGQVLPISDKNNLVLGVGYGYKRFTAAIKYHSSKDLTDYPSWEAKYGAIGINFGYKIL